MNSQPENSVECKLRHLLTLCHLEVLKKSCKSMDCLGVSLQLSIIAVIRSDQTQSLDKRESFEGKNGFFCFNSVI